jgi:hypothetical protein
MPPEGVRRSSRIPREIAILLVGSDVEGKMFSERTKTVLLSRYGAGIVSTFALAAEQELILRRLDTNKEAEVRVVGQLGSNHGVYTYGVAFLDPQMDLWGIKFPGMTDSEKVANRVVLQCCGCRVQETVEQSDLESDVYLVNEGIFRTCKNCGTSTFWKRATDEISGEPVRAPVVAEAVSGEAKLEVKEKAEAASEAPAAVAVEPTPAAKPQNKRKHLRTKVSCKACIRSFTFGDDVVNCEDMSRGGLCFKSRKEYVPKMDVEVAAPYSPGGQAIFMRGQIAYVLELKQERRYRCGVAYKS